MPPLQAFLHGCEHCVSHLHCLDGFILRWDEWSKQPHKPLADALTEAALGTASQQ
jgi:hypothetical protein